MQYVYEFHVYDLKILLVPNHPTSTNYNRTYNYKKLLAKTFIINEVITSEIIQLN